jgi:hypothetical protein
MTLLEGAAIRAEIVPYRLDDPVAAGTAKELLPGRTHRFWSSVEAA